MKNVRPDRRSSPWARRRRAGLAALTLGTGAAVALASFACAAPRRPAILEPEHLVYLWETPVEEGPPRRFVAAPTFEQLVRDNRSFSGLAAFETGTFFLPGEPDPVEVRGASVSAGLFEVLGAQPQLGRVFLDPEDRPGGEAVALLGDGLWRRQFGGDPSIVGRTISIGPQSVTVVGVMPPRFDFPPPIALDGSAPAETTELWLPLARPLAVEPRDVHDLAVIGRLAQGVTRESAETDLQAVAAAIAAEHPETNAGWTVVLTPFAE